MSAASVHFPDATIPWYDKPPSSVTVDEYRIFLQNFISKLSGYQEIMFYHMPTRFHCLYKRLVQDARNEGMKVTLISHVAEIK